MILGRVKFRYSICLPLLVALFLMPRAAHSATIYSDISVELAIEIGNQTEDYADAGIAVEKDRFVKYRITITNNGDIPHNDITVQMDNPDYMAYVPGTAYMNTGSGYDEYIPDTGDMSIFNIGYTLDNIDPGQSVSFYTQYQARVPEDVLDDPLYTVAWASVSDIYSGIPKLSQTVETTISSTAKPVVQGTVEVLGGYEGYIMPGMQITYSYKLHNVGGIATSPITFTTFLPENMEPVSGFGTVTLDSLDPNEEVVYQAVGKVKDNLPVGTPISSISPTAEGNFTPVTFNETEELVVDDGSHYPGYGEGYGDYGSGYTMAPNEFMLIINQVPNFILNSADGVTARTDKADLTETQYSLLYGGRGQQFTYPDISDTRMYEYPTTKPCGVYRHPNYPNASFYAYNSTSNPIYDSRNDMGIPESLDAMNIQSSPVIFNVNTVLPETSPKLIPNIETPPIYSLGVGDTSDVNEYMQNGGIDGTYIRFDIPSIFTESRAIENGAAGIVSSEVTATITEKLWRYEYSGYEQYLCTQYFSCSGEDCTPPPPIDHYRPIYTWKEYSLPNILLKDDDTTNISVYTSTAWLKTEGGHIGTNSYFQNEAGTFGSLDVNLVDLPFYQDENNDDDYYHRDNEYYLDPDHHTSSSEYTPPWGFNSEYMIFGNNVSVEGMKTSCGQEWEGEANCNDWLATDFTAFKNENEGTSFVQKGDAYDRVNNPRNYEEDMLVREKFGEVRTNELPTTLTGIVDLGDNIIWSNTGDITIGSDVDDDMVTFSGGQSRIYTTGTVYIKADIKYQTSKSSSYNDITSVRIDAENIEIDGEVEDVEAMLLARNQFHSGVSKKQLRILGDVIAKNTFWEREPLLEYFDPLLEYDMEDINKPSEYIIEDMRKYIVPAPGDTELPDDYTIWRQVNPATGEVLDGY